jgi:hypothetical protein
MLKRVTINTIPNYGSPGSESGECGCCPHFQILRNSKIAFSTTLAADSEDPAMQWAYQAQGSMSFSVDMVIQGDILLICRHRTAAGSKVSMFRAAFHTGYIPSGVLRLTKVR